MRRAIEGPTHFSQFVPLLHQVFGDDWFVRGCISSHYQNMVVEGEEVQAMVEKTPTEGLVRIAAQKRDGTPVLMGTASLGPTTVKLNWSSVWHGCGQRISW